MMKLGFAGAGYIAKIHAKAALKIPGLQLSAVVDKFSDKALGFAADFGISKCFESVEDMIDHTSIDALVIGTPNYLHASQAVKALNEGISVLVEKPMAISVSEAEKMLEASVHSGAKLMVAHCWRFDNETLWLKDRINNIGPIIRTKGIGVHAHWGPAGWFTRKSLAGGGALVDMGIHAIDTVRFLLGDPLPVSVYAKLGTFYSAYSGSREVDDTGQILITWDNGTHSYIESGWWQPHADGPEAASQLYGKNGFGQLFPSRVVINNPGSGEVELSDPGFIYPRDEHCTQEMYDNQMRYFIDCINNSIQPVPGANEGLVNIKIIDGAYKSAKNGCVINISN